MNVIGERFLTNILESFWSMFSSLLTSQFGYTIVFILSMMVVGAFFNKFDF